MAKLYYVSVMLGATLFLQATIRKPLSSAYLGLCLCVRLFRCGCVCVCVCVSGQVRLRVWLCVCPGRVCMWFGQSCVALGLLD